MTSTLQKCRGHETEGKTAEDLSQRGGDTDVTTECNVGSSLDPGTEGKTSEEAGRGTHGDSLNCPDNPSVGLELFQTKTYRRKERDRI